MKKLVDVLYNVLVRVVSFIFPSNFILHDFEFNFEVLIILRRTLLEIGKTLVVIQIGKLNFL